MAALDPRVEEIRKTYGLAKTDFWEIQQKPGTWVAKHAALEVAAAKAGITFDLPVIIEQNAAELVTSLVVQGVMGTRREWATGETNPSNYKVSGKQPSYPWAMAEKRAKDRVILKLLGVHGLIYSEEEGDFTMPKGETRDLFSELRNALDECETLDALAALWLSQAFQTDFKKLKPDWQQAINAHKEARKDELSAPTPRSDNVPLTEREIAAAYGD